MKSALFLSAAFALSVAAQEIDNDDFPSQCQSVCQPIVEVSNSCDQEDDSAELDCICNGDGIAAAIPACVACVAPFQGSGDDSDDDDDDDGDDSGNYDDIVSLLRACNLPSATVSGAPTVTAVTTSTYTTTETDDDGEVDTDVDSTTIFSTISGSAAVPSSTVVTTTNGSGNTVTRTQIATGAGAANTGSSDDSSDNSDSNGDPNGAVQTAAPLMGIAMVMGAMAAL